MALLTIILGVLLMIGGISCLFTPLATFLAAGYLIGIMLFIYGIISLIHGIRKKAGILAYIPSILAILVGFLAVFRPGGTLAIDFMILVFLAIWFLVQGVITLFLSIRFRKGNPVWGLGVVSGILAIAAGIISLIYPHVQMFTVGILISISLIDTGLGLISLGSIFGAVED